MHTGAGAAPPRVVIVDLHVSDSFREFDAALRQRGVDVLYLRPAHTGRTRAAKRAVDRLIGPSVPLTSDFFSDTTQARALRASVLGLPTIDVHATEPMLARLSATEEWRANPSLTKVRAGIELREVVDKLEVGRLATSAQVAVPHTSTVLTTDRFPVVVKGSLGAGGMSVRVAADDAELAEAVRAVSSDGDRVYLERYHPGGTLGTCGVARAGEVLVQGAYERTPSPSDPLGPPVSIRLIHDAEALAASERLIAAIGYTGIWCLNFVRDDDGRPLLIDVNVRAFGSWLSIDDAGVPILDSYLDLVGVGRPVPQPSIAEGPWLDVVRVGITGEPTVGGALRYTAATSRLVWSRRGRLGWGWMLSTQLRLAQGAAGVTVRAMTGRRR
jgi:hypothetical protein